MDGEPKNSQKSTSSERVLVGKIDTPEIILVGSFFALIDIIDLIGLLVAFPLSDFTSLLAFPASQLYAYFRGIRQDMILISNFLELIPWIGDLPIRTVAFGITVYIQNHPKLKAAVGVAEKVTGAGAGETAGPVTSGDMIRAEEAAAAEAAEGVAGAEAAKEGVSAGQAFGELETPEAKAQRLFEETPEEAPAPEEETTFEERAEEVTQSEKREGVSGETTPEGEEGTETEEGIEAERLGGAYAQTEEAQQKKQMEEAGLTEEMGTSNKKTEDVDVDEKTGTVNLRTPNDNIIDGRSRSGRKPPESEQQQKAA